jgi:hypothetical protein
MKSTRLKGEDLTPLLARASLKILAAHLGRMSALFPRTNLKILAAHFGRASAGRL